MHLGGVTASPTGERTVQQARNLALALALGLGERLEGIRFLIAAADRTSPSAGHLGHGAACRAAAGPVPVSAAGGERPRASERDTAGPAWRPAGPPAGHSGIPADGRRDAEALEASAGNAAAVAAYRLSVQAGNPLSERRLAQMFGRTSRRWARARIADARQASPLPVSPSTLVPACAGGLGRSAGAGPTRLPSGARA